MAQGIAGQAVLSINPNPEHHQGRGQAFGRAASGPSQAPGPSVRAPGARPLLPPATPPFVGSAVKQSGYQWMTVR